MSYYAFCFVFFQTICSFDWWEIIFLHLLNISTFNKYLIIFHYRPPWNFKSLLDNPTQNEAYTLEDSKKSIVVQNAHLIGVDSLESLNVQLWTTSAPCSCSRICSASTSVHSVNPVHKSSVPDCPDRERSCSWSTHRPTCTLHPKTRPSPKIQTT